MKKTFLLTISLLTLFTSNAFATHAYRSQRCVNEKFSFNYNGNYPFGGLYGIRLLSQDQEDEATAASINDEEDYKGSLDADVMFEELTSINLKEPVEVKECYFDHSEWTSKKVIQIGLLSEEASKKLGLKRGDQLTFICEETTDYPNGNECEKEHE